MTQFMLRTLVLVSSLALLPVWAEAVELVRQSCLLGWDAPTTNADATPLTDLANYTIYVSQTSGVYGAASAIIAQPTTQIDCTVLNLPSGVSYVTVKARDTAGNESVASPELSISVTTQGPRIQHHRRQ